MVIEIFPGKNLFAPIIGKIGQSKVFWIIKEFGH